MLSQNACNYRNCSSNDANQFQFDIWIVEQMGFNTNRLGGGGMMIPAAKFNKFGQMMSHVLCDINQTSVS